MIKVNTIDHIKMEVLHMEDSISFYKRIFGFKIHYHPELSIIGNKRIKLIFTLARHIKQGSIDHFGFHVEDYDPIKNRLENDPCFHCEMEWDFSRSFYIMDPSGNKIEISENRGGGLDSTTNIINRKKARQAFKAATKKMKYVILSPSDSLPFDDEKLQNMLNTPPIKNTFNNLLEDF
jgi:lactoylglutathione lyase